MRLKYKKTYIALNHQGEIQGEGSRMELSRQLDVPYKSICNAVYQEHATQNIVFLSKEKVSKMAYRQLLSICRKADRRWIYIGLEKPEYVQKKVNFWTKHIKASEAEAHFTYDELSEMESNFQNNKTTKDE